MPGATRTKRSTRHSSAVQIPAKRRLDVAPDHQVERVLPGSGEQQSVAELLSSRPSKTKTRTLKPPPITPTPGFDPTLPGSHPYSRSHVKREKRKARERLAGGRMDAMAEALEEVHPSEESAAGMGSVVVGKEKGKGGKGDVERENGKGKGKKEREEDGLIGEGKGRTLKESARRAQIATNAKRIPAVMKHPAFKASPWATIRLHASNSLAAKETSTSADPAGRGMKSARDGMDIE